MGMYILTQENLAVSDLVYLFPHHDSVGITGWVYPILVWEGIAPEYLAKDKFY